MKRIYSIFLISGIYIFLLICSSCARTPVATLSSTSTNTQLETVPPSQNISKQQLISEVIPLLEKGTSEAYAEAWNKLRLVGNYKGKYWDDEEIQALLWFSYDMINVANGRLYPDNFSFISPDYDGVYHEQISTEVLKHITREEWVARYQTNSPMMATVVAKYRHPLPEIGMTAQQVLDTQWGAPLKINKTSTANSGDEQWVYANGKYIKFMKGIVVEIHQ